MKENMIKKLRFKFVCINMIFITVMLLFIMCTIIQFTKTNIEQNSIQMMHNLSAKPLNLIRPNENMDINLPFFSLRINKNMELEESISNYYNLSDMDYLHNIITASSKISDKTGVLSDYNLRFMRISRPTDQLLLFVDISHEITTIETLTRNCLLIGFFSFFVFLIISVFLADWAVKPVEQAWEQQKQFIADASHELKTPLTVILTNAELLKSQEHSTTENYRFSDNIFTMASQMRNLVNRLLELSRFDNNVQKMEKTPLNFSSVTEHSIFLFEPLFFEQNRTLEYDIAANLSVTGNREHLKQAIEILLDNAIKYSFPNTTVSVLLQKHKKHCELTVINFGNTIPPQDLTNIFKRFYRTDKSRTDSGSFGLGLSIAQSIILEHKGKIWAESHESKTIFHVILPLSET